MIGRGSLLLVLGAGLAGCATVTTVDPAEPAPIPEGRVAFRLTRTDGESVTLASMRGKPVVLTVFTTWSDLALLEVPRYKAIHERYFGRLQVIAVALDEDPEMIRIFEQTFEIPYLLASVEDKAAFTGPDGPLGPIGILPTSFILDGEGRVAARMVGMWGEGVLEQAVARLMD